MLHVAVDAVTHILTDAVVTDQAGADTAQLPALLEGALTRITPDEVFGRLGLTRASPTMSRSKRPARFW